MIKTVFINHEITTGDLYKLLKKDQFKIVNDKLSISNDKDSIHKSRNNDG